MCDWVYLNGHVTSTLPRTRNSKIDINQNFEIPRVRAFRNKTFELDRETFSKILETPRKKRQVSESEVDDGGQDHLRLRGLHLRESSEPSLTAAERFLNPSFVHSFKTTLPFPRPKVKPRQKVQRLAQYEQYLEQLLSAQRDEQEEVARNRAKEKEAVKGEESDLDRIQDLFPQDALRLYERDPLTMRMKGLIRKRSTTTSRLTRALSAKRIDVENEADTNTQTLPRDRPPKRVFLLENPVQFTSGVQSQDRHLFLFNDLLLVAKARSGGNFKLKEKVRVSEIWLTRCSFEDVSEVKKSQETSFVLGWPTTNVVATFSTQAMRDLWWGKLNEVISAEREKEPRSTNIQVRFNDTSTGIEYVKTLCVGPHDSASRCIAMALQHLEMRGRDPSNFQLWAKTSSDEAPYPLIGHERPFSIKLSCLRQGLSTEEGFDLDHCNNLHPDPYTRCQFILRSRPRLTEDTSPPKKDRKKTRKSPMRIRQVFRKSLNKEGNEVTGALFGLPLESVFDGDLPSKPIMAMLQQVFQKGPFTQGIFRKSASARAVKELREQLDAGADVALDVVPVLVTAALLKEFLRSLPSPLLGTALGGAWLDALAAASAQERLNRLKMLVAQLPVTNQTLLAYFLCVLQAVARRASQNLMTAANLGVCVGPSLVAPCMTPTATKAVPILVETLVTHCDAIMGPQVRHLLGDPPERPPDSGAEESDSLHSGGLRRDDSSIDSLERELTEPPRKDKISLSRDSGLTMSDSQLYTPDEEETSSSSSGSGRGYSNPARQTYVTHNKVSASYSVPPPAIPTLGPSALSSGSEYVRVYGGWEARRQGYCGNSVYEPGRHSDPQSHFQRQDWFRQRSTQRRPKSIHASPPPDPLDRYDSSTLSDDDSTPHVSRSNSRGKDDERLVHAAPATVTTAPPLPPKRAPLRHLLPVHVDAQDENRPPERQGRFRRRELAHKAMAHRSKSLPPADEYGRTCVKALESPPPPYRPPPRAPPARILGDHQEESYV